MDKVLTADEVRGWIAQLNRAPKIVKDAVSDVKFALSNLEDLMSGACQYCKKEIPIGSNTCAGCSDEHGP